MKHEKIIQRENGSKVKIVALLFTTPWGSPVGISNHVLTCGKGENDWTLAQDDPFKEKVQMSVDSFIKHGRKSMFYAASIGEILKVNHELMAIANGVSIGSVSSGAHH